MTRREAPRSSSVAPMPPLRKARTTSAVAAVFLLAQAFAASAAATACNVTVTNNWHMTLAFWSYDGVGTSCTDPYGSYSVNNSDCKSTRPLYALVGLGSMSSLPYRLVD